MWNAGESNDRGVVCAAAPATSTGATSVPSSTGKAFTNTPKRACSGAAGPRRFIYISAVRALACKWQRVIWRCWQDRRLYDEATYEAALRKNGSPLVKLFDQIDSAKAPGKIP